MKITNLSLLLAISSPLAAKDALPLAEQDNHHQHHHDRADNYAPIGVMGDHLHSKGQLMASYRYMFMRMEENFDGSSSISDSMVLADPRFMVTPTDMDMEMHMIGLMYSPTDNLSFMAMLNIVELSMNHERMDGLNFSTRSSGIGDSSIGALFRLNENFHAGLSVLLPTAEVDKEDFIPGPGVTQLPYPMQLGAGSWGIAPSLTYRNFFERWSFGAQLSAKLQLDDNDQGYRLGNRYELTSWAAVPLGESFSVSFRASLSDWADIKGSDEDLLPLPVPTARPDLRSGTKLDAALGLNYLHCGSGVGAGIELGKTLWQDLDAPQLGSDWFVTAGLRFSF